MKGCLYVIGIGLFVLIVVMILFKLLQKFLGLFERLILFIESHALTMLILGLSLVGIVVLFRLLARKVQAPTKHFED